MDYGFPSGMMDEIKIGLVDDVFLLYLRFSWTDVAWFNPVVAGPTTAPALKNEKTHGRDGAVWQRRDVEGERKLCFNVFFRILFFFFYVNKRAERATV